MTDTLAKRIHDLAVLDRSRRVFGSKTHNYVGTKVAFADLGAFEARHRCVLPTDFRRFLREIGTGVGPYYGILTLSKVNEELQIIEEDYLAANARPASPGDPFALERRVIELKALGTLDIPNLPCPETAGGFMPVCHHGCEFTTVLILSGRCAGLVMDTTNFASTPSEWFPAKCPPGVVEYQRKHCPIPDFPNWPTFSEWMDGWLRQSVSDLGCRNGCWGRRRGSRDLRRPARGG
jgi:hypothetical protein